MSDIKFPVLRKGTVLKSDRRRYKIVSVLGSGGFGITYKVETRVKVDNVIVPVHFAMKEHFMESCYRDGDGVSVCCPSNMRKRMEASLSDFIDEAKKLQLICALSPSIVSVNEVFMANNTAYYVMEFLNGDIPDKVDEADALRLIIEVAHALSVVHDNHILHLDVKPSNVVFRLEDGRDPCPVLIDFGQSMHFDEHGRPIRPVSASGVSIGYAPPEQFSSIERFDPRYDVYSLGALLLYMVSGVNPPDSRSLGPYMEEIQRLIPDEISPMMRKAILHAMHPRLECRTECVEDFVAELCISTDCSHLGVSLSTIRFGAEGGTIDVEVDCDAAWDMSFPSQWISLVRTPYGLSISCMKNDFNFTLQDVIILKSGQLKTTVRVIQDYDVSNNKRDVLIDRLGSAVSVRVNAANAWVVNGIDTWVHVQQSTEGISISADHYECPDPRYGRIAIATKTSKRVLGVLQVGPKLCLSEYSITLAHKDKAKKIKIISDAEWSYKASHTWIKVHKISTGIAVEASENLEGVLRMGFIRLSVGNLTRFISVKQLSKDKDKAQHTRTLTCIDSDMISIVNDILSRSKNIN